MGCYSAQYSAKELPNWAPESSFQLLCFCTPVRSPPNVISATAVAHTPDRDQTEPTSAPTWIASNAPGLSCTSPVTGAARQQSDVLPVRAAGPSEPSCLSIRREARQSHSFHFVSSLRRGLAPSKSSRQTQTRWSRRLAGQRHVGWRESFPSFLLAALALLPMLSPNAFVVMLSPSESPP